MANEKVNTTVDVTQVLSGFDGKTLTDPKIGPDGKPIVGEDGQVQREPVQFRTVALIALQQVGMLESDRNLPSGEKSRAFKLAARIATQDKVTLDPEDIPFLLKRLELSVIMNAFGACETILNPGQLV